MKIKYFVSMLALSLGLVSTSAHAFFFFFIPGSVTSKIADAFTGAEGENCVGEQTKVGDNIKLPNGGLASVKSLSGISSRCTQPQFPIRALLGPVDRSKLGDIAGIELPEGWGSTEIPQSLKAKGVFFYAANPHIDAYAVLSGVPRSQIQDIPAFVQARAAGQASNLNDAHVSGIEQIVVRGMPAWRFEVQGKSKISGMDITYLATIVDADVVGRGHVLVYVNSWSSSQSYPANKEVLSSLPDNLAGINAGKLSQADAK